MKRTALALTILLAMGCGGTYAQSHLCRAWGGSRQVGELDETFLNEASGIAFSRLDPGRLYLINDSGDSGRFYVTSPDGSGTEVVGIEGFAPRDTEDLTIGACPDGSPCLFIADIGDNQSRRDTVEIVVVREQADFPPTVAPERRIRIQYPDGPHDAESIALHPNGDLFILTKNGDFSRLRAGTQTLYRLPHASWLDAGPEVQIMEPAGQLDLRAISSDAFSGSLPTSMDITADGQRLLVLTYLNAFEFDVDLSDAGLKPAMEMVEGVDYREVPLMVLEQQESAAWLPAGDGFVYTTEARENGDVPLMQVPCGD